jgi:predicted  nucleic acid-binding Zn-ribbon protein
MSKEYKSPPHKLVKFFRESRDAWEKTAKERREAIRDLQARVRDLEASRATWKEKAKIALGEAQAKEKALEDLQNELAALKESEATLKHECGEYKKKLKHSLTGLKGTATQWPLSA